ncbi:hypothetical protein [Cryobacterium sp. TMT4-31]|uniref:hypothetical protein n=1 Tax=Cryobacterium sp. TMT4-31 TaxID=1259259 RepID=UPI0010691491|nr:hypothetical protein [Cryobacterium sp. TMT4-31]TFC87447.1 hypothetical protein E3T19_12490 [Cryobacterium sp. TMT4-31]
MNSPPSGTWRRRIASRHYRSAELAEVSDPNVIHELQNKLDHALIYEESEVEGAAKAWVKDEGNGALTKWLTPAKHRFSGQFADARVTDPGSDLELRA